jgi:hypothetical protein
MCMADARGGVCPFLPSGKTRRGVRRELEESWKRGRRKFAKSPEAFWNMHGRDKAPEAA